MKNIKPILFLIINLFLLGCNSLDTKNHHTPNYVEVELPISNEKSAHSIDVYITADNQFYVEDKLIEKDDIEQTILHLSDSLETKILNLYADSNSGYENAIYLIKIAKKNKFKIIIQTERGTP